MTSFGNIFKHIFLQRLGFTLRTALAAYGLALLVFIFYGFSGPFKGAGDLIVFSTLALVLGRFVDIFFYFELIKVTERGYQSQTYRLIPVSERKLVSANLLANFLLNLIYDLLTVALPLLVLFFQSIIANPADFNRLVELLNYVMKQYPTQFLQFMVMMGIIAICSPILVFNLATFINQAGKSVQAFVSARYAKPVYVLVAAIGVIGIFQLLPVMLTLLPSATEHLQFDLGKDVFMYVNNLGLSWVVSFVISTALFYLLDCWLLGKYAEAKNGN